MASLLWEGFAGDGLTRNGIGAALATARIAAFDNRGDWLPVVSARPLADGIRICLVIHVVERIQVSIIRVLHTAPSWPPSH